MEVGLPEAPALDGLEPLAEATPAPPRRETGRRLEPGDFVAPGDILELRGIGFHRGVAIPGAASEHRLRVGEPTETPGLAQALPGLTPFQVVELNTWSDAAWPGPPTPPGTPVTWLFRVDAAWRPDPSSDAPIPFPRREDPHHHSSRQALLDALRARCPMEFDAPLVLHELATRWDTEEGAWMAALQVPDAARARSREVALLEPRLLEQARRRLHGHQVVMAIARRDGVTLEPEQVRAHVEDWSAMRGVDPREVVRALDADPPARDAFLTGLLFHRTLDHVVDVLRARNTG